MNGQDGCVFSYGHARLGQLVHTVLFAQVNCKKNVSNVAMARIRTCSLQFLLSKMPPIAIVKFLCTNNYSILEIACSGFVLKGDQITIRASCGSLWVLFESTSLQCKRLKRGTNYTFHEL